MEARNQPPNVALQLTGWRADLNQAVRELHHHASQLRARQARSRT
jgi:hypothetical protein